MVTSRRALVAAAIAPLMLAGLFVRLAPLTSERRTIAAISEDGYLMLTVARNIARGRSLTVADGTIATNGVQPLTTFLWAGVQWMYDGDRIPALRAIVVVQLILALVTAALVGLLAREAFHRQAWRNEAALLAASLWFSNPLTLRHTTNGLETGPYVCAIAAILFVDLRWRRRSLSRAAVLGCLLGLLFLVRNDAVFLIGAFLLAELTDYQSVRRLPSLAPARRVFHAIALGVAALIVASPWLAYNSRVFGHIVPVSGRAQNLNAQVGENLVALPRTLAEYAWLVTPLPASLGQHWMAALAAGFILILIVAVTVRRGHAEGLHFQRWMTLILIHGVLLALYYGVFFGAAYFLSRYLFPLSLAAVLLPCIWVFGGSRARLPVAAALTVLVAFSAWRFFARGSVHDHSQVVEWVAAHVAPETWVGAPQSGTLGYFHDRTINLDGKVNPLALQARRQNRLFHYIVDDTAIEYIVDWYGLARWVDRVDSVQEEADADFLRQKFDVFVRDPRRNLVVLKRRSDSSVPDRRSASKGVNP
jgi:hypothetical protein